MGALITVSCDRSIYEWWSYIESNKGIQRVSGVFNNNNYSTLLVSYLSKFVSLPRIENQNSRRRQTTKNIIFSTSIATNVEKLVSFFKHYTLEHRVRYVIFLKAAHLVTSETISPSFPYIQVWFNGIAFASNPINGFFFQNHSQSVCTGVALSRPPQLFWSLHVHL